MHFLRYLALALVVAALGPGFLRAADVDDKPPDLFIGYTEFRTDLPGGRYVNQATFRAVVVKADGTGRRMLAEELTREKNFWTEFRGWSPDGKIAVFARAWMSDENGKWEEQHKTFRYPKGGFSCDGYLFDLATATAASGGAALAPATAAYPLGNAFGSPSSIWVSAPLLGRLRRPSHPDTPRRPFARASLVTPRCHCWIDHAAS